MKRARTLFLVAWAGFLGLLAVQAVYHVIAFMLDAGRGFISTHL